METTTRTAAPRQRKPRPKPARSIKLLVRPAPENAGVVRITVGKESADYLLTEVGADFGRGFLVEKVCFDAPAAYHVNIDGDKRTCECPGFVQHSHCKHLTASRLSSPRAGCNHHGTERGRPPRPVRRAFPCETQEVAFWAVPTPTVTS